MKRFKTLLWKDWIESRKVLFVPIWIILGIFVLQLIGLGIAVIRHDISSADIQVFNLTQDELLEFSQYRDVISYIANFSAVIFPGFLGVFFALALAFTALNNNFRHNCELFHRTQPVSEWYMTASKYIINVFAIWGVIMVICLFDFILINAFLGWKFQVSLSHSFIGLIQNFLSFMIAGIVAGSFAFFCSSIFKDKAFLKTFAIIIVAELVALIMNKLYGWNLPHVVQIMAKTVITSMESMKSFEMLSHSSDISINTFIIEGWKGIFNLKVLMNLVISGMFYAGATFIYKIKEVK